MFTPVTEDQMQIATRIISRLENQADREYMGSIRLKSLHLWVVSLEVSSQRRCSKTENIINSQECIWTLLTMISVSWILKTLPGYILLSGWLEARQMHLSHQKRWRLFSRFAERSRHYPSHQPPSTTINFYPSSILRQAIIRCRRRSRLRNPKSGEAKQRQIRSIQIRGCCHLAILALNLVSTIGPSDAASTHSRYHGRELSLISYDIRGGGNGQLAAS